MLMGTWKDVETRCLPHNRSGRGADFCEHQIFHLDFCN